MQKPDYERVQPFHDNSSKHGRCCKCREIDTLNYFGRCADCELAYQKDLLLETVKATPLDTLDNDSLRLIAREFQLRAAELLARGHYE